MYVYTLMSSGYIQTSGQTFLRITQAIFKRKPAVKNIDSGPAQDQYPQPRASHRGIQGREEKESFKSQALIFVNQILC